MRNKLQEAWENAHSLESRDKEEDRYEDLNYIGAITTKYKTYHFYQGEETGNYWYTSGDKKRT
ncbi:MAG: hypothetical protein IJN92_09410 [Lachnospiraceae bacterium]|nr:hypothetical protein [Lachnospiraceae bacterium]